ncbi:MAG TPA: prephenate dehydrogenase/arogenate dehydrogenase family protein, partial [Abditibacteriaceae bacterium]|nr:prephenate dehydrogenase/arogenate dehydrogenase family protein [Abditibacteriaceae bacterium]
DAGSTKAQIVEDCAPIFSPKSYFVGGHPMAGSEQTGVEASRADLFEGAVWVLTPTSETLPSVIEKLIKLAEGLGAQPLLLDAGAHDELLAVTSHVPHITAAALVHLFAKSKNENELVQQLVASGWRDSTRIAAGSAEMWRDISLANASALTRSLDEMIAELQRVRGMLAGEESDALSGWFEVASHERRDHNCSRRDKRNSA